MLRIEKKKGGMLTNTRRCVLFYCVINTEAVGTWQGCIANVLMDPFFFLHQRSIPVNW